MQKSMLSPLKSIKSRSSQILHSNYIMHKHKHQYILVLFFCGLIWYFFACSPKYEKARAALCTWFDLVSWSSHKTLFFRIRCRISAGSSADRFRFQHSRCGRSGSVPNQSAGRLLRICVRSRADRRRSGSVPGIGSEVRPDPVKRSAAEQPHGVLLPYQLRPLLVLCPPAPFRAHSCTNPKQ